VRESVRGHDEASGETWPAAKLVHAIDGVSSRVCGRPGGAIDPGETALQAAVRETEEEAGITPLEPTYVGQFEYAPGLCIAIYATRWRAGSIAINWESCARAWMAEAQLAQYDFVPPVVEALRASFAMRRAGGLS
jgi:ADP-ribose pyrophosphatase YjhB (NUDIX family)